MAERRNTLLAASHVIVKVEELANKLKTTMFSSVGLIEVQPNSPNTIADYVQLWIEWRSPDEATLEVVLGARSIPYLHLTTIVGQDAVRLQKVCPFQRRHHTFAGRIHIKRSCATFRWRTGAI